jgi:predicted transglutaminase-like cysteine proteinase
MNILNYFGIITSKKRKLVTLRHKSTKALNIVTSTIKSLNAVNDKMNKAIVEIDEAQNKLLMTKNEYMGTMSTNSRIIDKFKNLIENK